VRGIWSGLLGVIAAGNLTVESLPWAKEKSCSRARWTECGARRWHNTITQSSIFTLTIFTVIFTLITDSDFARCAMKLSTNVNELGIEDCNAVLLRICWSLYLRETSGREQKLRLDSSRGNGFFYFQLRPISLPLIANRFAEQFKIWRWPEGASRHWLLWGPARRCAYLACATRRSGAIGVGCGASRRNAFRSRR